MMMTKGNAIILKYTKPIMEIAIKIYLNSFSFHLRCLNLRENIFKGIFINKAKIGDRIIQNVADSCSDVIN